jgi:hypothetical protein
MLLHDRGVTAYSRLGKNKVHNLIGSVVFSEAPTLNSGPEGLVYHPKQIAVDLPKSKGVQPEEDAFQDVVKFPVPFAEPVKDGRFE